MQQVRPPLAYTTRAQWGLLSRALCLCRKKKEKIPNWCGTHARNACLNPTPFPTRSSAHARPFLPHCCSALRLSASSAATGAPAAPTRGRRPGGMGLHSRQVCAGDELQLALRFAPMHLLLALLLLLLHKTMLLLLLQDHADIIQRFGRFPHRNLALGESAPCGGAEVSVCTGSGWTSVCLWAPRPTRSYLLLQTSSPVPLILRPLLWWAGTVGWVRDEVMCCLPSQVARPQRRRSRG